MGSSREIERIRRPVQHEHRVQSTDTAGAAKFAVAVEPGLIHTLFLECRDPFPARLSKFLYLAEANRTSWASGGASRSKPTAQSVVAEGALVRPTVLRIELRNTERARRDAIAAPVANVVLDDHGPELGSHDRAGGTRIQATR